jgi:hypothetical protein
MTGGQRVVAIVAALIVAAIVVALGIRPRPSEPAKPTAPSARLAVPGVVPPAGPVVTDAGSRPPFASAQLDAQERSEQEATARISTELELSAAEREAVKAALKKLHTGRHQQFARLIDGSADEAEMTAGLQAHHVAFDEDIAKAIGAARAKTFQARFDEAYGTTAKDRSP